MFERYTERARRVIFFARYEASKAGSATIETGHLLLGLLRENKNLTNRFLPDVLSIESIRKEIEQRSKAGRNVSTSVDLPLSDECKRILAYANEEADRLRHRFIGTEHLLLGILREEKCVAAEVLVGRGLSLNVVREEIAKSAHDLSEGLHLDFLPGSAMTHDEIMVPDAATASSSTASRIFSLIQRTFDIAQASLNTTLPGGNPSHAKRTFQEQNSG